MKQKVLAWAVALSLGALASTMPVEAKIIANGFGLNGTSLNGVRMHNTRLHAQAPAAGLDFTTISHQGLGK